MKDLEKSNKLLDVCYDIRGPVLEKAVKLEEEGQRVIKLNIGNPAPFGFDAPDEIIQDIIKNMHSAEGYSESKGIFSARKAVVHYYQTKGILDISVEDITLGNGVSELIVMATQALLNNGDEVLIPSPDYPLWTAAANLAGGKAIHYRCDEASDWLPDINDIKSKVTSKTKAIVVINPNNPTGAVYHLDVLKQIAAFAEAKNLVVFADEIYDKILYEDAVHHHMASLIKDTLCVTFNGLSKSYRLAGFRSGWAMFSGNLAASKSYIEGFHMLSSMRLCSNVPAQLAIQTALGGYQSIQDLVLPSGRLFEQRELGHKLLTDIPGVSCVKPKGGIYLFPKLDPDYYPVKNDEQMVLDFLTQEKILLVQGTAFNASDRQHLRIVFLPRLEDLTHSINRLSEFLQRYKF